MRDDEQLRAALLDLRSGVATIPMRSPGDVRARGDQRTWRQRAALAGTSALAVAAVVGGTALTTGAPQARRSVVPPATSVTSTAAPTPTPTTSQATATGQATTRTPAPLVLEPDGLGLLVGPASIRHLTFADATADQVSAQLRTALGSGTTTPSPDCGAGLSTFTSGRLSVLLKGSTFLGWTYQALPTLTGAPDTATTADGIGVGSTLAELRAARAGVRVSTATIGPEFVEPGGLSGLLDGTTGSSRVILVRAGQTCSFR